MDIKWIDQNQLAITVAILIIFILIILSGFLNRKNKGSKYK